MKEILIATRNRGKVAEIVSILSGLPVKVMALDEFAGIEDAEETGDTFYANAVIKARHYAISTGKACLADDSGLEVDALDGAPGVYSARYAGANASDEENNRKLLKELANLPADRRTARFCCVLAFYDLNGTVLTVDGTCEGRILEQPRGNGGFGYDPLFYLPELGQTLAELAVSKKNAVSHRGKALKKMVVEIERYLRC